MSAHGCGSTSFGRLSSCSDYAMCAANVHRRPHLALTGREDPGPDAVPVSLFQLCLRRSLVALRHTHAAGSRLRNSLFAGAQEHWGIDSIICPGEAECLQRRSASHDRRAIAIGCAKPMPPSARRTAHTQERMCMPAQARAAASIGKEAQMTLIQSPVEPHVEPPLPPAAHPCALRLG